MARVLVLAAHPTLGHSRVTRRLMRAAAQAAPAGGIEVRDLYALYPDYLVDVAAEQAQLAEASLVVWLHPVHWYSMPPLLKLWVDEVLAFGWAYGPGGTALRGKDLWLVTSTGGPADSYSAAGYNRRPFEAFLPPYEQTAALTGMRWLPPLVLHGAHRLEEAALDAAAADLTARLERWPDWPGLATLGATPTPEVPADARPDTDD